MNATRIEVRTKALRAGRHVNGVWEPAGQLICTLWVREPGAELAREVEKGLTRIGDEEVVAEVIGREEVTE